MVELTKHQSSMLKFKITKKTGKNKRWKVKKNQQILIKSIYQLTDLGVYAVRVYVY